MRLLSSELDIILPLSNPIRCVTKVSNVGGLISEKTKRKAVDIMSHIKDTEYSSGKKPMGLASNNIVYCLP